jgi:hypothetical protein
MSHYYIDHIINSLFNNHGNMKPSLKSLKQKRVKHNHDDNDDWLERSFTRKGIIKKMSQRKTI